MAWSRIKVLLDMLTGVVVNKELQSVKAIMLELIETKTTMWSARHWADAAYLCKVCNGLECECSVEVGERTSKER